MRRLFTTNVRGGDQVVDLALDDMQDRNKHFTLDHWREFNVNRHDGK